MINVSMKYGGLRRKKKESDGGGGITYTRLWTNSAPATTFGAQTITLSESLENYNAVRIVWQRWIASGASVDIEAWATNPNCLAYTYDLSQKEAIINATQHIQMGAVTRESSYYYWRRAYFPSATNFGQISFGQCMRTQSTSDANNNGLKPLLIDGVKWS